MIECGWGPLLVCNLGPAGGHGGRDAMIRVPVCSHVCVCVVCRQPTSLWVCVKRALGGWEIASLRKRTLHLPPADTIAYITTLLPVRRTSPFAPSLYYPFIPPSAASASFSLSFFAPLFLSLSLPRRSIFLPAVMRGSRGSPQSPIFSISGHLHP